MILQEKVRTTNSHAIGRKLKKKSSPFYIEKNNDHKVTF